MTEEKNVFHLKPLELPPSPTEVIGLIALMFMTFLANAGGLGGGGTLTPFMMIFFKLPIYECVPLANVFGMIAAATRFIINFKQKHPNQKKAKHGKLSLDYEIVSLTMPLLYLGTLFGVQIGTYLDEVILALSLGSVLLFVFVKTLQKAIDTYKKEN